MRTRVTSANPSVNKRASHKLIAAHLLKTRRQRKIEWRFLHRDRAVSRRDANKFLLGAILDYQIPAKLAWDNAQRLAETILHDPPLLWHRITARSLESWMSRREQYGLHRFPKAHERVYTIGRRLVGQYGGDARRLWRDRSIEATLYRLNDLGVGQQLSRMVVGALIDTKILVGRADVKVDRHVRRVLGRLVRGRGFDESELLEVIEVTRAMHPRNPWTLDQPLYQLGQGNCRENRPKCKACDARPVCAHGRGAA
jgi:endonuclease III